ncbi:YncE family protein [Clostridium sp. CM028]|uniref:YncE family protein n=1 Tax=unclassified Clostridium TaxID=2614128 RepID=UPI001C0CFD06|nr:MULTISPECIES: YncE family protein [unclassified Clostridium]MBU3092706.1 YncE family protein [Clostridium sp. CF011]MBW9149458.1 YncE family protein [Clostridium sp. CM028]WAG70538.1 YncE family protein [Clostridium sp. CF011]WLC62188.1 YncE family protein [Clostridium sp. CM028]
MIEIAENIRKSFYFVSNVKTGTLTIIDSLCNTILKEISVGKSPFRLALKDNNTIGVACDMSNTISFINCITGEIKENIIPNNGNFQIDTINKKIYVSNTSEVTVYDINLDNLIGRIKGLSAIIDLRLNKEGTKLYVLDTLLKELRIYSTENYGLIHSFKNLGINPTYLLISEDDKTAYISMRNTILKIDINSEKFTDLILPKGSLIAGMILKDATLYASNFGLNRIELINTNTNEAYDFIITSKPEPTRLFITDDNTKLLVANRNRENHGGIDIIDLKSNSVIGSILMNTLNSQPYDVISLRLPYTYVPPAAITNLQPGNQIITIIAKKIFASYNENLNFPIININLPKNINSSYIFEKIKFEPGIIVEHSEFRSLLSTTSGFASIKFIERVNYIIDYLEDNKNNSINGFFEKPIEVFLDIPKDRELNEFQLKIKTITELTDAPKILQNVISFGVTTLMELNIIGDDEISIINSKETPDNVEEHFEAFDGFSGSIFPDDTVFTL